MQLAFHRILPFLLLLLWAPAIGQPAPVPQTYKRAWWKEAVVYQLYPRSFQDSDGNGVGDLKGIISRLDYLQSLGVDAVWLNPIFPSPNADNGYDISDYRGIMAEFGTMQDFDSLLAGLHRRGIRLVLDLVANHSSDQHPWFIQSRSSRTSPYRSYYHWWPAERGKPTPRLSFFDVNSDAWAYDSATNAYYLHYFGRMQPDLNWENPRVRREVHDILRFWFDKGVDGFRMDVIPYISKDTTWPRVPGTTPTDYQLFYARGPHLHEYLREMNREVLSKYDVMTLAEGAGVTLQDAHKFVDPARQELDMLLHFEGMGEVGGLQYRPGPEPPYYDLRHFKRIYTRWDSALAGRGWGTVFLGNHDQPRMASRWGDDRTPALRNASSKLLTTFLMTMRGTVYFYNGDELGMTNIRFDSIRDYRDILTINKYLELKKNGATPRDLQAYLEAQKAFARDNSRTPFQWSAQPNAGFTAGTPWIRVHPGHAAVNVAAQQADPASPLHYFRKAVALRRAHPALVYGRYRLLDAANPSIYAYTRTLGAETLLVVLNFSPHGRAWPLPAGIRLKGTPLLNNYPGFQAGRVLSLQPWQAVVVRLR